MAIPNNIEQLPLRDPILVEREKTHGKYADQAYTSQTLKGVVRCKTLRSGQQEALEMICVKISRILHGNPLNKDHWDDIAGYAKLGSEACDR